MMLLGREKRDRATHHYRFVFVYAEVVTVPSCSARDGYMLKIDRVVEGSTAGHSLLAEAAPVHLPHSTDPDPTDEPG